MCSLQGSQAVYEPHTVADYQTRVAPAPGVPPRAVFARWGWRLSCRCLLSQERHFATSKNACATQIRMTRASALPSVRKRNCTTTEKQYCQGGHLDRCVMTSHWGTALKYVADRLSKILAREWFLQQHRAHRDLLL